MAIKENDDEKLYVLKEVLRGESGTHEFYERLYEIKRGESREPSVIGKHVYGDLYFKDPSKLTDKEFIKNLVVEAAEEGKMHIISISVESFKSVHGEENGGVSVTAIILESHIAIHTWPEDNYANVDIFSCGKDTDPHKAFEYIIQQLKPYAYTKSYADRSNKYKI
ncbi:MAG: adenosylmethionine decarboxylase [Candidatus Micrarchaeia archaeon]